VILFNARYGLCLMQAGEEMDYSLIQGRKIHRLFFSASWGRHGIVLNASCSRHGLMFYAV
jgi:hypothetical protein